MTALKLIDFSPLYCDVVYAERLMANARTTTACNAKPACRRQCLEFIPGEKYGRDTEPSCLTCTHSRAIHQQPDPNKRKTRR